MDISYNNMLSNFIQQITLKTKIYIKRYEFDMCVQDLIITNVVYL